jgi:thermitase
MMNIKTNLTVMGIGAGLAWALTLTGPPTGFAYVPDKDTPKLQAQEPSGRVIVKFKGKPTSQGIASLHGTMQAKSLSKFEALGAEVVEITGKRSKKDLEDIVAKYKQDPNVEFAELDGVMTILEEPPMEMGVPEDAHIELDQLYLPVEEGAPEGNPESPIQTRGLKKDVLGKRPVQRVEGPEPVEGGVEAISYVYNDPQKPWGIQKIYANYAWRTQVGTNKVIVAVVDTGVDRFHEDLQGTVINGRDFYNNDYDAADDHGHGTHVSGTIAATLNNNKGVTGVAPNVYILAVKVCSAGGSCPYSAIANGIIYAAQRGAKVINLSLGGSPSLTVQSAVAYAWNAGVLLACAAGNGGPGPTTYPAAYSQCLAVAATDQNDQRASFSQYAPNGVAAPGVGILSTLPSNRYASWSGTSMATPHVAGVASLLFSQDFWHRNNQRVRYILTATTRDIGASGKDPIFGYGRIDAWRAVNFSSP